MANIEAAIEKLRHLPKRDQNHFAALVLDEEAWNRSFTRSASKLDQLGPGLLADIEAGWFKPMSR
jgi:hypothetical protein